MILKTKRLVLRPWRESDAEQLYEYAKDDRVGPIAGWSVHKDIEESRHVIREIFMREGIYAVTLKEDDRVIGCVGLVLGLDSNLVIDDDEGEVSYWLGVPYWGNGLIPEAVGELLRYGFEVLKLRTIWCGAFEENKQSHRVQEKCGFHYHHTDYEVYFDLIDTVRNEEVRRITKEQWLDFNRE